MATVGRLAATSLKTATPKSCAIIFSTGSLDARTIHVRQKPCLNVCNGVTCHPLTKSWKLSLPIASGKPKISHRLQMNCSELSGWICVKSIENLLLSHEHQNRARKLLFRKPFRRSLANGGCRRGSIEQPILVALDERSHKDAIDTARTQRWDQ